MSKDAMIGLRIQRADRAQVQMRCAALDELLAEDHTARIVWQYVMGVDLSVLYQKVRTAEGCSGRAPIDPRILLALWLYATLQSVGSGRQLARLCEEHIAYQWLCGGVSVNHHTLSDFRIGSAALMDRLLTDSVATLMHEGLVTLERVAQDGMRVRASAGAGSFRRRSRLERCRDEAREHVRELREQLESDPAQLTKGQQAARQRAAAERSERVERALAQMHQLEQPDAKPDAAPHTSHDSTPPPPPPPETPNSGGSGGSGDAGNSGNSGGSGGGGGGAAQPAPRVSTTDPEARVMKMPDGGFRPAYNVQFATDTQAQIITAVDALTTGSDFGQLSPMVQQHHERYGRTPDQVLADGGFAQKADIEKLACAPLSVTVYAPVQKSKKAGQDPHQPREGDSPIIAAWRRRMATDEAKQIYKQRGATAECVNAIARNRGMRRFLVRGREKVRAVALLFAVAHNLIRAATLRQQAAVA